MQKKTTEILVALILGILYPAVLFSVVPTVAKQPQVSEYSQIGAEATVTVPTTTPNKDIRLLVQLDDGSVTDMELEEYITAVVLCEMPAEFETEALKAQGVVARTYALKRKSSGTKHAAAAVCTNPSCCQGFISPEEYVSKGGDTACVEKVSAAVQATAGQVLLYNGELIEATYFSCSGGMTEDAAAVWGSDVPYLRATESPGEENATHYVDTVRFSVTEFKRLLQIEDTSGSCQIGTIRYTDGGGVDSMQICGETFHGTTLRSRLGLRSTAMSVTVLGNTVTITTKGFGHRVGMSQYGADAMAVGGSTYDQILAYYYAGTELATMDD